MSATIHRLPTAAPAPTSAGMSDAELRAWWLGYHAGYCDCAAEYEEQNARLSEAADKFLATYRPALKAVQ